jgi:tungstate transport system substrate-binding protein
LAFADQAHIKGSHDAVAALKAIAGTKAPFVSHGDNSGTNALELRLWKSTGIDPKLINRYDVIQLNPERHGKERLDEARQLADWRTSPEGQSAIGSYEIQGEQFFHPSAAAPK